MIDDSKKKNLAGPYKPVQPAENREKNSARDKKLQAYTAFVRKYRELLPYPI
jgi:hypothetical protein